jgi:hypothetical protein
VSSVAVESLVLQGQPGLHLGCPVRPQAIHDQEHLPNRAPQQAPQEHQEQGRVHRLSVDHEPDSPLVADRRDLASADVAVGHFLRRRLAPGRVAPRGLLGRCDADLIGPVDGGALCRGPDVAEPESMVNSFELDRPCW